jgi:3-phenylpropionate/trans-cinnamate dioxygenase ferredoxin reductase subunit
MTLAPRILVVGAGLAAAQVVSGLREAGWDGELTVVGDEGRAPYHRPPLSKGYLKGTVPADQLDLRAQDFYADRSVTLVVGERVLDLGLRSDGTGAARCGSRRVFDYDRVVLATGASPRSLPLLAGIHGVHDLRSAEDADRLRAELCPGARVVVLGAGFVGLEVAATARQLGCAVTVVEAGPQALGRIAGPVVADHVVAHHRARGIGVRTGVQATAVGTTGGRISSLELDDGTTMGVDVVVVGIGAQPRVALAEAAGLVCAAGVVVDGAARASDGVTLAVGDCAVGPTPVRLESVDYATQGAAAAVATILGTPPPAPAPPWFWSDQGDLKLQIAGLWNPGDECVVRRSPDSKKLACVYFRRDQVMAAEVVDSPAEFVALRRAVAAQSQLDRDAVADPEVRLGPLVSASIPV